MSHFLAGKSATTESKKSLALKKKIDEQIKKTKKLEELSVFNRFESAKKQQILEEFDKDEKFGPIDKGLTREQRIHLSRSKGIYPSPTVIALMKEENNKSVFDMFQSYAIKNK